MPGFDRRRSLGLDQNIPFMGCNHFLIVASINRVAQCSMYEDPLMTNKRCVLTLCVSVCGCGYVGNADYEKKSVMENFMTFLPLSNLNYRLYTIYNSLFLQDTKLTQSSVLLILKSGQCSSK